jgi:3-(3-hydroxy-phenyl)propionate hydroxylase
VQCEQHKLADIVLARLEALPNFTIEFSTRVCAVGQRDDRVEVQVETAKGLRRFAGSYLIGADGGRSTVRRALEIDFEGYTHPERFLVLTTTHAFGGDFAACWRNYFSDPDEWSALFKVAGDDGKGRWRVVFPTRPNETVESAFDEGAVLERLQRFFPKVDSYPVVHRNLCAICTMYISASVHRSVRARLSCRRRRPHQQPAGRARSQFRNSRRLEEKDPATRAKNNADLRAMAADPAAQRAYLLPASLMESVRRGQATRDPTAGPVRPLLRIPRCAYSR